MSKKRWLILSVLVIGAMLLGACGAGGEDTAAQIATLEAALAEAQQSGGASEETIADLQSELDSLQGELSEAEAARCTYNGYRMGWVMDYADANNIVNEVFGPTSDFQYTFWQLAYPEKAAEFEALVADALHDTDLEHRALTWQAAENILMNDVVALLPLFHYDRTILVSDQLNFFYPPFGSPKLSQWSFKDGRTTLIYPLGAVVPTLDINDATDTTSHLVLYQLIDSPYRFTKTGSIEPAAASSFDVSEDGTVFTVHLREDAVWSDGVPVTAQNFVDGITRLLSPELANDYAYIMFPIEGASEYNAGEIETLDSVVAVDDTTLQITLTDALSYFDSIMAFSTMDPVRMDLIEAHPDDWTQAGNFLSNGAYVLAEHSPGEKVVLTKNELYWDAANVSIDTIEMPIIVEQATSLAAFENGEVDVSTFPPEDTERLMDTPYFNIVPYPGTYYAGFNLTAQHTNNRDFRIALSEAVDKRTILDEVAQLPWRAIAYGVIPPEIYGYQGDKTGWGFDVEDALVHLQAYMDAAGIEDPSDITVELWYNKEGSNPAILEAVEAMWEENLGINVETVNVEWGTYLDTLEECNVIGGGGF
jgi:oligopeptide transport system substrate-binding protein